LLPVNSSAVWWDFPKITLLESKWLRLFHEDPKTSSSYSLNCTLFKKIGMKIPTKLPNWSSRFLSPQTSSNLSKEKYKTGKKLNK
jgi:hypothetical protein